MQEQTINGNQKESHVTYDPVLDEIVVKILCEWAVSCHRWGEHRAMTVARLLDKRQTEIKNIADPCHIENDTYNGASVFQTILMHYLDHEAPILDANSTAQDHTKFINLVHLFCELIRHDVFSHDTYLRTLISRGELSTVPGQKIKTPSAFTMAPEEMSIKSESIATPQMVNNAGMTPSHANTPNSSHLAVGTPNPTAPIGTPLIKDEDRLMSMEFKPKIEELDDSNVDDDLNNILQNIKEDQQNAMDAPDSPKEENHQDR